MGQVEGTAGELAHRRTVVLRVYVGSMCLHALIITWNAALLDSVTVRSPGVGQNYAIGRLVVQVQAVAQFREQLESNGIKGHHGALSLFQSLCSCLRSPVSGFQHAYQGSYAVHRFASP